ncbi:MAG: hypothetical protein AB1595_03170, partial [bacterium]
LYPQYVFSYPIARHKGAKGRKQAQRNKGTKAQRKQVTNKLCAFVPLCLCAYFPFYSHLAKHIQKTGKDKDKIDLKYLKKLMEIEQ